MAATKKVTQITGAPTAAPAATARLETIKIGGIIQTTGHGAKGKATMIAFAAWVNSPLSGLDYNVALTWVDHTDTLNYDTAVAGMSAMHVLVAPYTSGASVKFINATKNANMNQPVLVWGGASDSIFTTSCTGVNCFGSLTVASKYTKPSLDAIKAKQTSFTIAGITNNNGFSKSVHAGTNAWCTANSITMGTEVVLSVSKTSLAAVDTAAIDALAATNPDVVTVSGHPGDVEEVIMQLQSHATFKAKAIIATNAWSGGTAKYTGAAGGSKLAQLTGVIMPDQWAEDPNLTDAITSFTSPVWKAGLEASMPSMVPITYHAASAASLGIAVLHALAAGTAGSRTTNLVANMKAVDTSSFYGQLSFNADGSIKAKPMYGKQYVTATSTVVIPPNSNLVYPMGSAGTAAPSNEVDSSGTTRAAVFSAMAMVLAIWAGVVSA
jgi:hypothetical protein